MLRLQDSYKRFITHRFVFRVLWFDSNCDHKSDFKKVGFELSPRILTFKTFYSNCCEDKSFKIFKGFEWFWQIQWVLANLLYYKQLKSIEIIHFELDSKGMIQSVIDKSNPQIWIPKSNPYKKIQFDSLGFVYKSCKLKKCADDKFVQQNRKSIF
jgi:hypothetical protein